MQSIVIEAETKRSKVQKNSKSNKAFQGAKKNAWMTELKSHRMQ